MKIAAPYYFMRCYLFGAAFLFSISAQAQVEQTARYEREHKSNDLDFILVPMGDQGITLIKDTDKYKEGKKLWEITLLDEDLTEVWTFEMDIEARLRLLGYDYKDDLVYLLFRTSEHEGGDLNLFTVHSTTREVNRFIIQQEVALKITHFCVLNRAMVLGGYVINDPAVLVYDLAKESLKIVPGFFSSETELLDLRANTNNTFNTLIIDRNKKEKKRLILKTFDASGALLFDDMIEIDARRSILSGITSTLINDELLITGTWTQGISKMASGIYSVMADPFSDQAIKFYDFGELENFLSYQSPKRVAKLKQKSVQAKNAGSIPDFKTYTSVIRVEEQPGAFALLTEVYQSNLNSSPNYPGFSNPYYYGGGYSPYGYYPSMNRYYNPPYQYNNNPGQVNDAKVLFSSLVVFDTQGNLINDYGLVLDEKKSDGLEQTTDFLFNKNEVAIVYKKEKEILVKHNKPGGSTIDTLQTSFLKSGEIVRSDAGNGRVRFWYQNYMYTWGYQRIRDVEKQSEDPTRYVFYINKVRIN